MIAAALVSFHSSIEFKHLLGVNWLPHQVEQCRACDCTCLQRRLFVLAIFDIADELRLHLLSAQVAQRLDVALAVSETRGIAQFDGVLLQTRHTQCLRLNGALETKEGKAGEDAAMKYVLEPMRWLEQHLLWRPVAVEHAKVFLDNGRRDL